MFQGRLLTGLGRVDGTWRNFLAMMFFLLLHFFVVRDIAWISHEPMVAAAANTAVGLDAICRSDQV